MTTKEKWIAIRSLHDLPSKEVYGPYPTVHVILQRNHNRVGEDRKPLQSLRIAELRYFGKDLSRPFWVNPENQGS